MNLRDQFPNLYGFLAGYFHQDWYLDDPDAEAVIQRFAKDGSSAELQQVADEITLFLALNLEEEKLKAALLGEFYCYYDPDGISCTKWLVRVKEKLIECVR